MDRLTEMMHKIIFALLTVIAVMVIVFMVVSYRNGYFTYSAMYWVMGVGIIVCMDLLGKERDHDEEE